jgi:ELWxxDGT repeat protein
VGRTLFFTADDGIHGRELWKSNGTKAGTVLVKDIYPGTGGEYDPSPDSLTRVGGTLFFTADDGTHGPELWKSDGTRSGTVLVKDIAPRATGDGPGYGRAPGSLTAVGGTLFFTVDDGTHGRELWKSNGTKAGTVLVKDIEHIDNGYGGPSDLTAVGGTVFFNADNGTHGSELWKSNGTKAGTVLVKDIHPGPYGSYASALTESGGNVFFTARDGTHGPELWKSNGTTAGTVLVKDIRPDARGTYGPRSLTNAAGTLFFLLPSEDGTDGTHLWKSDGTETGTVVVKELQVTVEDPDTDSPLTAVGSEVYFTAEDGAYGSELWKSDGSETGTALVKDIRPGVYDSGPSHLASVDDTVFFTARDGAHGPELWKSDGTQTGTALVKDIGPGTSGGYGPTSLTGVGGNLFMAAVDGARGSELWKSNGTEAGTVLVKDINAGGAFTVAPKGRLNTRKGTLRVTVSMAGAGRLVVAPAKGSRLKKSVVDVRAAGTAKVTLRPTRAGLRKLHRTGKLRVKARYTFTPCGGVGTVVTRRYTLRLR